MFTKVSRNETRVRRHKRVRTKLAELQNAHVYAYSEVTHTSMFKSLMMLTKTHWSVLQVLT